MSMQTAGWTWIGYAVSAAVVFSAAHPVSAAPSNVAAWTHIGLSGQRIGTAAGTAGDFNCDGVADLLVGGPYSDYRADGTYLGIADADWGWIGVYYGGSTFPPQPSEPPDWVVVGQDVSPLANFQWLGEALAAGDVNRDGCDDVIATTGLSSPSIRVYFGSPTGPSLAWGWRRSGLPVDSIPPSNLPYRISLASGDVNGDGTADIILGLPEYDNGQTDEGAVFVWLGSQFITNVPDGLADPDWFAESNQQDAHLGASVSAGGDVNGDGRDDILAGVPDWDGGPGSTNSGRALMWFGSPVLASAVDGTPTNAAWSLQIGVAQAQVGAAVAIPGDLDGDGFADILVGAPDYDSPFTAGTGEGLVLVRRGATSAPVSDFYDWSHTGQTAGGRLGSAVASAGDVNGDGKADYLIGEPEVQLALNVRGRVHLLLGRATSAWTVNPASDVVYSESGTGNSSLDSARYGSSVATAGDWNNDGFSDIVIGAPNKNHPVRSGQVFVYVGRGETLASLPVYTIRSSQPSAILGIGVAFAGDINQDGYTDIVSGSPSYESAAAQTDEGRVFINYGGSCGPACGPLDLILPGDREANQAGANLGWSVSGAGDVNGDGFADVIAGAPLYDGTAFPCPIGQTCPVPDVGRAQVFLGSSGGLAFSAVWTVTGATANAKVGYSVAGAGDVNGDGFGDVIVGVPLLNVGQPATGRALLYLGSAAGLATSPSWVKDGTLANAQFGIDVAGAGDVNGDGFSDVIIGAYGHGATGAAFVYLGRPTTPTFPQGLSDTPIRTLIGIQAGSQFGVTVASAGDVNRDGLADIVVGAPEYDDDPVFGPQVGMVSIYHGAAGGPSATASINLFGEFSLSGLQNRFGNGVAGAGDVNGDGYGDLIVGDQWNEGSLGFAQGEAYIFHGSASGIVPPPARIFQDCPHSICDSGRDVAGGGDVNGDGFSDVLISAYRLSDVATDAGGVFVHLGNEGRGTLPVRPLQSQSPGGAPIALLGAIANSVDLSLDLKSPAGRSRVGLEVEVKPLGQDFNGLNTLKSSAVDNGNALTLRTSVNFTGTPGSVYQWRARIKNASPIFGRSRWVSLPENGSRETDMRVLPEPGVAAALFAGMGALAGLARRRGAGRA